MKLCFLFIACFLFFNVNAEGEWKKKKEKSGIIVYTRKIANAPMDEFKGLVTLSNTTIEEVINVILDITNYPKWIPDCLEAEILLKEQKYHSIHYVAMKAPWPVTNRDAIHEMNVTFSDNNKQAHIDLHARGDYIKEKEQFLRLHKGSGFWQLEETENNSVKVTYQFLGDPGGKIPAWLANSFVVSNPYNTLLNLKEMVVKK